MSKPFQISARAKTNLWLRIVGKREDGFHDIETRMVHLSLADQLTLEWTSNDFVEFTCSDSSLPTDEENLVVKAVRVLEQHTGKKFGIQIHLDKNIPSGAGLGGGSSDAAAVLIAINEMAALDLSDDTLAGLGAQIGSDIPFFVYRKTCDCSGRGEIVRPTADSGKEVGLPIVLLKP
ncbi:MAG: 4-(cytidine 5'-diphospho)-2-C-methyl-D-erythritol kinase, partial [Verrucomicrobiota bacterium]